MLMYFEEPADKYAAGEILVSTEMLVFITINGAAALVLGLLPSTLIDMCRISVS